MPRVTLSSHRLSRKAAERTLERQEVARCNSETSTLRDAENGALEGEPLVVPLAIPLIAVFAIPR